MSLQDRIKALEEKVFGHSENRLHVVFCIDESGSMGTLSRTTIEAFNNYVRDCPKETWFTVLLFDEMPGQPTVRTLFKEVPKDEAVLSFDNYKPRGSTPLYDAVYTALNFIDEAHRYFDRSMLVIQTDGFENASRQYKAEDVKRRIERGLEEHAFEVLYLGTEMAAWDREASIGIPANRAFYSSGMKGMSANYAAASVGTQAFASADTFEAASAAVDEVVEEKKDDVKNA